MRLFTGGISGFLSGHSAAMRLRGVAVHEESVLASLLAGLGGGSGADVPSVV
ncbi:hypothetical protein [Kribbella alba]|uniref:hypothetical protein n=1 Tax=Kribbella alba TaxID=190197 RepID=UPI0031DABC2D